MTGWPDKPVIYEVNTAIWLSDLSRAAGRHVTLADVPASAWDEVTPDGVDAVWLMGVWERSPAGLELANANAGLQAPRPWSRRAPRWPPAASGCSWTTCRTTSHPTIPG